MSIEIQFLAWDWHKNVSGSKLKNGITTQGRIQDFKLGGAQLKKLRRAEGGAKIFEVFRVNFTPKKYIFSNFRGGGAGCAPATRINLKGVCNSTLTQNLVVASLVVLQNIIL